MKRAPPRFAGNCDARRRIDDVLMPREVAPGSLGACVSYAPIHSGPDPMNTDGVKPSRPLPHNERINFMFSLVPPLTHRLECAAKLRSGAMAHSSR
jgi:hypothetical protein